MGRGHPKGFAVAVLMLVASACARESEEADLAAIAADARVLLEDVQLPTRPTPAAFVDLHPREVRRTPEGIYICIERRGVEAALLEEWGYFVPRNPATFDPGAIRNPSYRLLGDGVYRYDLAG